jgi:protoporphyrinogen oxidase
MRIILLLLIIMSYIISHKPKRVAIIGSGLSGLNLARLLLKKGIFKIDLYESSSRIGGRIKSIPYNNTTLDMGGFLFYEGLPLIDKLIEEYKLEKEYIMGDGANNPVGFFNGTNINFQMSNSDIYNTAKLMWRYGMSPVKLQGDLDSFKKKMFRVYSLLEKKEVYRSMEELNNKLDIHDVPANMTISEYIKDMNLHELYKAEMINSTLRAFFGQHDPNAYSAFIVLALLGIPEYRIKGGNGKLIQVILDDLKKSNDFNLLLNTEVTTINKDEDRYILSSKEERDYDLVVIAAPLSVSRIKFHGLLEHLNKYRKSPKANSVTVTYIEGELNEHTFQTNKFPRKLISVQELTSAKINSIFNLGNNLYRVHSVSKIHQNELEALNIFVSDFKIVNSYTWEYASARYDTFNIAEIPGYVLDTGLLYTNAHEPIDTSMECTLITSINLANLVGEMYPSEKKDDM